MRAIELIQEALSKVVFHATTLEGGMKILKTRQLIGSRDGGDYYVSFSRNRTGEYPKYIGADLQGTSEPIVIIEFNGDMLSAKHRANPVNPFYDPDDDYGIRAINFQEDRLHLGRKEFLSFSDAAVQKIHVIVNGDRNIPKIASLKSGGKVLFYKNLVGFMTRKPIEKPVYRITWSEAIDLIDQLSYTTSPDKVRTIKRALKSYANNVADQSTLNALGREFYKITMQRQRTIDDYLDMF